VPFEKRWRAKEHAIKGMNQPPNRCFKCTALGGFVTNLSGQVVPCPDCKTAPLEEYPFWMVPMGHSLDTGRRNIMSRSADDGII